MRRLLCLGLYKSLSRVERAFRSLKSIDVDLRPIHHHIETRVRAHVFICMLVAYLIWHLRAACAPLTFTDEHRPDPADPVAPARRSQAADHKAATKTTNDDLPTHSFTGLLNHLAHPDPQPPAGRRPRRRRLRPARRGHPQPTPSLRTPGCPDPTHPEVARTRTRENSETPGQQGFRSSEDT